MPVITQNEFSQWIEFSKVSDPGTDYLDHIKEACDHFIIDYECVRPLISDQVKQKLAAELMTMNVLKRDTEVKATEFIK